MTNSVKYNEENLRGEIMKALDAAQTRGDVLHPLWITHAICKQHRPGLVAPAEDDHVRQLDVAFWEFGGYTITRKVTTACINGLDDEDGSTADDAARSPFLPGFEHECLQRYYVFRRDGVDVGVPLMECTDDELRAKAALYLANSAKLEKHASELIRFIDYRAALRNAKAM